MLPGTPGHTYQDAKIRIFTQTGKKKDKKAKKNRGGHH